MTAPLSRIEIVAIGEELLSGATIDTNAARIAAALEPVGIRVVRKTTVGDAPDAITDAVAGALDRTGAVITTGGLGPTRDDATKGAIAALFGRDLEFRDELWRALEDRWGGVPVPESNRSQAEVPAGATVFPNPRGTAPGLAVQDGDRLCVLLPGVPGEMRAILDESVVPFLAGRAGVGRRPFRRELRTASIAEAAIADRVGDRLEDLPVEVAYLPEVAGVDVRITGRAEREADVGPVLDEAERRLRDLLGPHIYGTGGIDLADVVGARLRELGLRVAVAESCTAGLVAARLTESPGASDYFWGGMIVYDDAAKIDLLDVPERMLREHGAVSEAVAIAMADGACRRAGVETSIAVTGIAGPAGGTEEKPVGTVWLAVRAGDRTTAKHRRYAGTRDMIRARAAQGGLDLLRRELIERGP